MRSTMCLLHLWLRFHLQGRDVCFLKTLQRNVMSKAGSLSLSLSPAHFLSLNGCYSSDPTCSDGVKNGAETGVDCGGGTCPTCGTGGGCGSGSDCTSGVCKDSVCQGLCLCVHIAPCGEVLLPFSFLPFLLSFFLSFLGFTDEGHRFVFCSAGLCLKL